MKYREEIDGLRAIAVLPVILFHGGITGFSGGYIGVDIFFVISGYLITSIIAEEIQGNKFSLINFYERRARRILPALSLVLLLTTIAAFLLMPSNLLKSYSESLASVALFSSNIFFYLTSGYFSTVSDEKPLLHTWSLAVEEQYYIFFPIMLSALWFWGKKKLLLIISAVSTASLVFSHYLSIRQSVDANFYLIFSRAWELFFGSIIALSGTREIKISKIHKELFSITGLSLICYSIVFFDRHTPFPSFYTLVPVLGTCAIIVMADRTTLIGRFLANKLFVFIGLLSYSLYLWHQPLFAFLRLKTIGEPPPYMFIGAIALTFVFSYISWKYLEKPFRNRKTIPSSLLFKYSSASITVFIAIGLSGYYYDGFESRFEYTSFENTIEFSPKRKDCHTRGEDYLKPNDACKYFTKNTKWASFGDSHTVEIAYALARKIEKSGHGLVHLSFSGCPPALLFDVKIPGCTKWINESLEYLEKNAEIDNVLLGFRHSAYLFGDQLSSYPDIPKSSPTYNYSQSEPNMEDEKSREMYWDSFSTIINRLVESGKTVHVLYPIPELPIHISKAVKPFSVLGKSTMLDLEKTTSASYYFKRNEFIISKLDSLPYGSRLHAIKPFDILCNNSYCPAVNDGKALYFDDDHLSISGADKLISNSVPDSAIKLSIVKEG